MTVKFGSKTMVKDKDYVIVYSDNTNPGTATITIVGTGNFTVTKVVTFNIIGKVSGVDFSKLGDARWK